MVTLTGTFTFLDGAPASGTVRVKPSRSPIVDVDGKIVISGSQVFPLDKDGKLVAQIPASDDPDIGPPFTYTIDADLTHASWKISKVWIPHGSTTVDLSEIGDYQPTPGVATRVVTIPADGEDGQVLVWDGAGFSWMDAPAGPQGPPGEVTTAALTTALAGKVNGPGMTLRRDNSVGTRVLLDYPGGTTMIYGDTGWRDVSSAIDEHLDVSGPGSYARIKIINGVVHFVLKATIGTQVGLDRTTRLNILHFPPGFSPRDTYMPIAGTLLQAGAGETYGFVASRSDATRLDGFLPLATGVWREGEAVRAQALWHVAGWPTTLPGIPVG